MNGPRTIFSNCTHCVVLGVVLLVTVGCDLAVRHEADVNVQRLAENWPPYQAPDVPGSVSGIRSAEKPMAEKPMAEKLSGDKPMAQPRDQKRMAVDPAPLRPFVPLIPVRRAEEWSLQKTAMDSLGRIGAPAVPALIEALDHENPTRREQAAKVLARIGPEAKQSVIALVQALEDENETVRKAAARALGQIGPEAEDAVIPLLKIIEDAPEPQRDPSLFSPASLEP